jgi:asparagine synthase (glutamine-hydrolysing)
MSHRLLGSFAWAAKAEWAEASERLSLAVDRTSGVDACDAARAAMGSDRLERLPDAMLAKVDTASMSESLEVRVPLLDDALVRYADSLATSELVGLRRGKLLLRRVLERLMPGDVSSRPKRGFSLPLDHWLVQPGASRVMEDLLGDHAGAIVALTGFDPLPLWRSVLTGETHMSRGSSAILLFWFASVGLWAERFQITDVSRKGIDNSRVI